MCRSLSIVCLSLALALFVAGCAYHVPATQIGDNAAAHEPASPFRAYEKVGVPVRPTIGPARQVNSLSLQIQRLQDARRAYQAELNFEAARTRHRQKACRKSAEGVEVPIQSGLKKPATYCQKIMGNGRPEPDKDQ